MQRIESGRLRGRRLLALPKGVAGLRPTAARVRGAIFDRLGTEIVGARVLDLFAGSGAMAIEALSRGAAAATLVETDRRVVRHLHAQLAALDLGAFTEVLHADAQRFLAMEGRRRPYDLVVIDPPFATPDVLPPLCEALGRGWLAPEAVVVCERERVRGKSPLVRWPDTLTVEAERIYGQAVVEYLRPKAADRRSS